MRTTDLKKENLTERAEQEKEKKFQKEAQEDAELGVTIQELQRITTMMMITIWKVR